MSLATFAASAAERWPLPDALSRLGISMMVGRTRRKLAVIGDRDATFAARMGAFPIAEHADAANTQHYEVPAAFFAEVLGPRRKYSSCLYPTGRETLAEAEERRRVRDLAESQKPPAPKEMNGPKGPEPTRYGDWEKKGIASDF